MQIDDVFCDAVADEIIGHPCVSSSWDSDAGKAKLLLHETWHICKGISEAKRPSLRLCDPLLISATTSESRSNCIIPASAAGFGVALPRPLS